MTIRTLLVDDEPIAIRGLKQRLQDEPDIEIVGVCEDGFAAIAAVSELNPDLIFLDIQMPELTGFDVVDAIGLENMPAVIFVTAYDQYAVRAFDVHAADYILKPVDSQRLQLALKRIRKKFSQPNNQLKESIAAVLNELGLQEAQRWSKRLAIKDRGCITLVNVSDISRIKANGNYAEIYTGEKKYLLRETLTRLEGRLDPARFARVSRSTIINIEYVSQLQPMFNGDFVAIFHDGTEVSGSRRYRAILSTLLV